MYYFDPCWFLNVTETTPNDAELGEKIREYVQQCKKQREADEPFNLWRIAPYQVKTPSELKTQLHYLKQTNNALGY